MTVIFKVQKEEDGFSAKAVNYPIFTQGDSLDDLVANIKESLACHFDNQFHGSMDMVYTEAVG